MTRRFLVRRPSRLPRASWWYGGTTTGTANRYDTANPGGIAGVGTGFAVWGASVVTTQSVASANRRVCGRTNASSAGWNIVLGSTNSQLYGWVYDGAGAIKASAVYSVTSSDVGKVLHWCMVHTGTELLFYVRGAQVGSATAITGFTAHAGAMGFLGHVGTYAEGSTHVGIAGGAGVPSAAEVLANYGATLRARDVVAISGKTDHLWSVPQSQNGGSPATIADQVGSDGLTKAGSPGLSRFRPKT